MRLLRPFFSLLAFLSVVPLVGCSEKHQADTDTVEIDEAGGSFEFGDIRLEVPTGAVSEPTEVTVRPTSVDDFAALPSGVTALSPAPT